MSMVISTVNDKQIILSVLKILIFYCADYHELVQFCGRIQSAELL